MAKFIVLICVAALSCVVMAREKRKMRSPRMGMGLAEGAGLQDFGPIGSQSANYPRLSAAGNDAAAVDDGDQGLAGPAMDPRLNGRKIGRWAEQINQARQNMMGRRSRLLSSSIPRSVMHNLRQTRRMRQMQGQQLDASDIRSAFAEVSGADMNNPNTQLQMQQILDRMQNRRPSRFHSFGNGPYRGGHGMRRGPRRNHAF